MKLFSFIATPIVFLLPISAAVVMVFGLLPDEPAVECRQQALSVLVGEVAPSLDTELLACAQ